MVTLMLENDAAVGKAFNCGTGKATRIDELAQTITDLYGKDLAPELHPDRSADIKHSVADISPARKVLGYVPEVELKTGLKKIIKIK